MSRTLLALALVLLATPAFAQDASESVAAVPSPVVSRAATVTADAGILVRHADDLGLSYVMESVQYSMGEIVIGNRTEFATKVTERRVATDGPRATVLSGPRDLTIRATIRGKGIGQFSYLNKYLITITGTCPVDMLSGVTTSIDVRVVRNAGVFAEFEDGLDIVCENIDLE